MLANHLPSKTLRSATLLALLLAFGLAANVNGQSWIRSKKPDRGVYQPPTIHPHQIKKVTIAPLKSGAEELNVDDAKEAGSLVPAPIGDVQSEPAGTEDLESLPQPIVLATHEESRNSQSVPESLQPADQTKVQAQLRPLGSSREQSANSSRPDRATGDTNVPVSYESKIRTCSCESCSAAGNSVASPAVSSMHLGGEVMMHDGVRFDGGCDSMCCDDLGCDGMCTGRNRWGVKGNWFGSIELMLMFRRGDSFPALVTTGSDADPDTAGEIGQAGTSIIAGNEAYFKDLTAGGRLTLGTWLDRYKDRSVVGRAWFAGEDTFGFSGNQDSFPVLTRPFFNVTDGETPEQDTQIIAFPDRAIGSLQLQSDSNVFGGDISIRQLWAKHYGATIDLLYGYQYMGLHESLSISSTSTSINDDFAPVGSVISISDAFDIENDFHGGQIGIATNYREGCWSFASLVKVGFGSIQRSAELSGRTTTSIDGNNASEANGLLVRSTNSGKFDDDTFGWVPELDFTFGWHRYPAFDVTIGYHLVVMTDALRVSGAIDPSLAVNLADTPTGSLNPSFQVRDDTFYLQGIHLGLSYIY